MQAKLRYHQQVSEEHAPYTDSEESNRTLIYNHFLDPLQYQLDKRNFKWVEQGAATRDYRRDLQLIADRLGSRYEPKRVLVFGAGLGRDVKVAIEQWPSISHVTTVDVLTPLHDEIYGLPVSIEELRTFISRARRQCITDGKHFDLILFGHTGNCHETNIEKDYEMTRNLLNNGGLIITTGNTHLHEPYFIKAGLIPIKDDAFRWVSGAWTLVPNEQES